jgi:bacillithiol synthase
MKTIYTSFESTGYFSKMICDYISGNPVLKKFYKYPPSYAIFDRVMEEKSMQGVDREILVKELNTQYSGFDTSNEVLNNISSLADDNTFSITTAHQPGLFTGPLYFIIKILVAINMSEELNKRYPDNHFVPVYWLGGEDHDFEEINHFHLFNKTYTWEAKSGGPVGRMSTQSLKPLLDELETVLGDSDFANEWKSLIKKAYIEQDNLADATKYLVDALFRDFGLIVLKSDTPAFKKQFTPVIKDEILNMPSQTLVQDKIKQLEDAGYHGQAFPREINLFYFTDDYRERIIFDASTGKYKVNNQPITFTVEALQQEVDQHPERFSPNVILRPVYQETILPNLAYVGGGGETAYWMQLESVFEYFKVNYPMLVVRNSVLWVDKGATRKVRQLNLEPMELFMETEALIKDYVKRNAAGELSFKEEIEAIENTLMQLQQRAKDIDPTLEKTVGAEARRIIQSLEKLEVRMLKAEKSKHEVKLNQIRALKQKLFPEGKLQERYDNITSFYLKYGDTFIPALKDALKPLDEEFVIVMDD